MSNIISTKNKTIALTAGDPAGIGPDLCVYLSREKFPARIVIIADKSMIRERANMLGLPWAIADYDPEDPAPGFFIRHASLAEKTVAGKLDPANSPYVLETIEMAASGCLKGAYDAMVTGPVHKGIINKAGIAFSGHTEYLAALSDCGHVVMMLAGGGMKVALATTHLALKDVPSHITRESLEKTIRIIHQDFLKKFGVKNPRIAVCGLNPHAGESGYLGREEIDIIAPLLDDLRKEGMRLSGPLPADTIFNPLSLENCDCVLAMYHDQGLPALKHASFGEGVNITLGLPFIRTSVDHGTAVSLAGKGEIGHGSMTAAILTAIEMAQNAAYS